MVAAGDRRRHPSRDTDAAMMVCPRETAVQRPGNAPDRSRQLAEYQLTRGDRLGAHSALIYRAIPYMLVVFACCTALFAMLGFALVFAVPLAAGLTFGITWTGMRFAGAAGEAFGRIVLPTGDSTPYEHQYSREDAMAARGDIAGALESLEAAIAGTPLTALTGVNVRIRAAELYMTRGADIDRAAALFREVRAFAGATASQDLYVSNRLIDLLLGPLQQPARALVELRRIVERYPSSAAATGARTAIVRIKEELRVARAEDEKLSGF